MARMEQAAAVPRHAGYRQFTRASTGQLQVNAAMAALAATAHLPLRPPESAQAYYWKHAENTKSARSGGLAPNMAEQTLPVADGRWLSAPRAWYQGWGRASPQDGAARVVSGRWFSASL